MSRYSRFRKRLADHQRRVARGPKQPKVKVEHLPPPPPAKKPPVVTDAQRRILEIIRDGRPETDVYRFEDGTRRHWPAMNMVVKLLVSRGAIIEFPDFVLLEPGRIALERGHW